MNSPLDQLKQKTIAEFRQKFANTGGDYDGPLDPIIDALTLSIQEAWEAATLAEEKVQIYIRSAAKDTAREEGFLAGIARAIELVPQEVSVYEEAPPEAMALNEARTTGWNECRRAMLAALEAEQPLPPEHDYCLSRGFTICEHAARTARTARKL